MQGADSQKKAQPILLGPFEDPTQKGHLHLDLQLPSGPCNLIEHAHQAAWLSESWVPAKAADADVAETPRKMYSQQLKSLLRRRMRKSLRQCGILFFHVHSTRRYVIHALTTSGQNEVLPRPTCLALWYCRCRRRSTGRSPKRQTNPRGCHVWWCHLRWCTQWWCPKWRHHAKRRWTWRIIKQAGHITATARHGSFSIPGWLSHSLKAIPKQVCPLNI